MLTEVRICGRKLFHRDMWKVLIDGKKWLYLSRPEMFVDPNGLVAGKKDMPIPVRLGFLLAWENNTGMGEQQVDSSREIFSSSLLRLEATY